MVSVSVEAHSNTRAQEATTSTTKAQRHEELQKKMSSTSGLIAIVEDIINAVLCAFVSVWFSCYELAVAPMTLVQHTLHVTLSTKRRIHLGTVVFDLCTFAQ